MLRNLDISYLDWQSVGFMNLVCFLYVFYIVHISILFYHFICM